MRTLKRWGPVHVALLITLGILSVVLAIRGEQSTLIAMCGAFYLAAAASEWFGKRAVLKANREVEADIKARGATAVANSIRQEIIDKRLRMQSKK